MPYDPQFDDESMKKFMQQDAEPLTQAAAAPQGWQNYGNSGQLAPAVAPPQGGGFPVRGMSAEQVGRANGPQKFDGLAEAQKDAESRGIQGPGTTTVYRGLSGGGYAPANMSRFEADARWDPNEGLKRFMNEQAGANNGLANMTPQDRAGLVQSYLGMTKGFGEGDKLDLQRYLGMAAEATSARNAGTNERTAGVAERKVADDEKKTGWTMSPDRIREQAQLGATQAYIAKMAADGKAPPPNTIGATNDIINGIVSQRQPAGGQADTPAAQANPNSPPGKDQSGKLFADNPQLAYKLNEANNGKPLHSPQEKLQMILQQYGSDWVKQNWGQVKQTLAEADPEAETKLREGSQSGRIMGYLQRGALQAGLLAQGVWPTSPTGQEKMKRANVPLDELWGRETQADKTNAFIRYMNGK